jgi:heme/copper-type cytochrome/quinol oxidase subunit 2
VIAYPGQTTTVRAKFDIEGLYVWHCHILEHEDNEMMRPYAVKGPDDDEDSDTDSDSRGDDDSDTDSDSRGDDDSEDSDRA